MRTIAAILSLAASSCAFEGPDTDPGESSIGEPVSSSRVVAPPPVEPICDLIPTTGKCLVVTGRFTACRNTFGYCAELGGGVEYSCLSSAMPLHAEGQYEVREVAKVGVDCAACKDGNAYVMAVKAE